MRLSWNEVRARAAAFSREWEHDHYERGEAQTFYNEFFEIFGARRRGNAAYERAVRLRDKSTGFIDLFWPGVLLAEQKSAGRSLARARARVDDYIGGLTNSEFPRYILLCDFQRFELLDLESGEEVRFSLDRLPEHVERFGFILGVEKREFKDEDPVNIKAAELMGRLHDSLENSGYSGHDLERLLVRILFCLFADDTGILEPRGAFEDLIRDRTSADGADTGQWLNHIFDVLSSPEDSRQTTLDEDLDALPYINGDLFAERLPVAAFNTRMRATLLECCEFNWERTSPAIFGSLFQSVMDPEERRRTGGHYTTERNILKVIEPLFLDKLRSELQSVRRLKTRRSERLRQFHDKLAGLRFLDPACGCGNFLVISYRELRILEIEVLTELHRDMDTRLLDVFGMCRLDVDQFYGIEIHEFPARIAEVAMWMTDHIMNNRLSLAFGSSFVRIPLKKSPVICCADALETDWQDLLPATSCAFVLGNPPYGGAKMQTTLQRAQVRRIANLGGSGGTLDFVAAWFLRAAQYVRNSNTEIAFVATNSITQGEQVAQLWPALFDRYNLEISFAHRTFEWGSDARGVAHVHVVILGLSKRGCEPAEKRLYSYDTIAADPVESRHPKLSPYLFDASRLTDPHLVVHEAPRPLSDAPRMRTGTQPIDDGHYIFTREERADFLAREPQAGRFFRPYVSGDDYLHNRTRYILALQTATPSDLRNLPLVTDRMAAVRRFRAASKRKSTQALAKYPERYNVEALPTAPFLAVPEVSSERRMYIPIAWLLPPIVPSNKIRFVPDATLWHFAVLTSAMHMAWTRYIGGRLKSDFQYSVGINYNPFPWPVAPQGQRKKIEALAQAVLDARSRYANASLADLYDGVRMKPDLRKAHEVLDTAIDRLYRREPFQDDRSRVEYLLTLYERVTQPIAARARKKGRKAASRPRG